MPDRNKKDPGRVAGFLTQLRNIAGRNIGTVIFGILFVYVIFLMIIYLTSTHIESYQVVSGPLARNETYTGLAIREETVYRAGSGGYVNYYAREGAKINSGGAVYGLSSTKLPESDTTLSTEDLAEIRQDMLSFSKSFSASKFNKTYSFKNQLEGSILQYAGVTGQSTQEDSEDEDTTSSSVVTLGNQNIVKALADGIVLYSKDGYEDKTVDSLTLADFDQNSYHETDLKTEETVKTGDDIYTLITDETWSLLIPLSDKQAAKLADRTTVRVKFLEDDVTQNGTFSIMEIEGEKFGRIDFSRGLIRYAQDRFLDIELVTNTVTGLKIPLTSIVSKEFFVIPAEYASVSEDSTDTGFWVASKSKDGSDVTTFVTPRIYGSVETTAEDGTTSTSYYVDVNSFSEGDALVRQDSQERFVVGTRETLEGVYCINQGYAVFRRVKILDQNEEYAIVSSETSYGISLYDNIVRDAQDVKEEDIVY